MGKCLISCPPCRPPGPAVLGHQVERVISRIGDSGTFSYQIEGESRGEGGVFPLPPSPHHTPRWDLAVTIPFRSGSERGLAFFMGGLRCFWSFESRQSFEWEETGGFASDRMVLVAMSTDPSPFVKFCRELLLGAQMHSGMAASIPPNEWPAGLHSHWFSVLLGISCVDPSTPPPLSISAIAHWLPSPKAKVSSLVRDLRVGSIVSAAWRTPAELPHLLGALSLHASVDPDDIDWQSLPSLCSSPPPSQVS